MSMSSAFNPSACKTLRTRLQSRHDSDTQAGTAVPRSSLPSPSGLRNITQDWAILYFVSRSIAQIRLTIRLRPLQLPFEVAQRGNLCADCGDFVIEQLFHLFAIGMRGILQSHQFTNLLQRETQFLSIANEGEVIDIRS